MIRIGDVLKIKLTCDCGDCQTDEIPDPCWVYWEFEDGSMSLRVEAR